MSESVSITAAPSTVSGAPVSSDVSPAMQDLIAKKHTASSSGVTAAQSKLLLDVFHFVAFALTVVFIETSTTFDFVVKQLIFVLILFYFIARVLDNKTMYGIYHCTYALTIVLAPLLLTNKHILFMHVLIILLAITTRKVYRGCLMRKLDRHNKISSNFFTKKVNWDILLPILGGISAFKLYSY